MKKFIYISITIFILVLISNSATAQNTDYFSPLWSFFDWVFESAGELKQSIDSLFIRIVAYLSLWWLELKIYTVQFTWNVVSPLIEQLDLSSVIQTYLNALDPRAGYFFASNRIPEAINMIISAFVTRKVLQIIGW